MLFLDVHNEKKMIYYWNKCRSVYLSVCNFGHNEWKNWWLRKKNRLRNFWFVGSAMERIFNKWFYSSEIHELFAEIKELEKKRKKIFIIAILISSELRKIFLKFVILNHFCENWIKLLFKKKSQTNKLWGKVSCEKLKFQSISTLLYFVDDLNPQLSKN